MALHPAARQEATAAGTLHLLEKWASEERLKADSLKQIIAGFFDQSKGDRGTYEVLCTLRDEIAISLLPLEGLRLLTRTKRRRRNLLRTVCKHVIPVWEEYLHKAGGL